MSNNSNTPDWGNSGDDWNQPQGNWNQPQGNNGADWNQPQGNWNNNAPDWNNNPGQNWNNPNQGWGNSNQNWNNPNQDNPMPNQNWGSNNAGWNNNPNQGNPMPNQNWGAPQQAPQPPKKKKKHTVLYILIAIVVLLIVYGVATSGKSGKTTHSSKTSSSSTSASSKSDSGKSDSSKKGNKKELAIGDSFEQSNMKMTLDSVQFDWQVPSTGDDFEDSLNKPKDGYTYVKMDVTMENTGDKDEFASFTDFKLYADNNPYDQEWGLKEYGVNPNGSDFSELSAGRKASFSVFWQVPVNSTSVEVEYEPSFWSNEKILIKVK